MEIKSISTINSIKGLDLIEFKQIVKESTELQSNYIALDMFCLYPNMVRITKFISIHNLLFNSNIETVNNLLEYNGIIADFKKVEFKVKDYYSFIKKILSSLVKDIICRQRHYLYEGNTGFPDFEIHTKDDHIFYIELKNENDTIRPNQLSWCEENKHEVWYVFVKLGHNFKF